MTDAIELLGAVGSPYTRKMIAVMRYRQIPHRVHWVGQPSLEGYPKPKIPLMPVFFLTDNEGELTAVTDSTPIIRRLEQDYTRRSIIPENAVMAFLNSLIEDFADEWLTKAMFHYRWAREVDYENAGPLLAFWSDPTLPDDVASKLSTAFTKRQIDRLYVVGSNPTTAPIIETAYKRFVSILDAIISHKGYILGARPSSADFAIYGQLSQLAIVEPTSSAITRDCSMRVRAWVDRMEDLSGLTPSPTDWMEADEVPSNLTHMFHEIGKTYVPTMLANAKAVMAGKETFETEVDGAYWTQPTFKYQAKCLGWLREEYFGLTTNERLAVDTILHGSGCEALFVD